jgi:transcriptional regulator GlxA family with amidase domain
MQIAIMLFPVVTALDAIGPYEILQQMPDAEIVFVGHRRGEVRANNKFLGLQVDASFAEIPRPDVVVVPGGFGARALLADDLVLDWVRAAHETSRYTTSVCTGSLVLGAAGLLDGLTATTHWSIHDALRPFGAIPVHERWVEHLDRRILTAAGVSAGIDMAIRLVELLHDETTARAAQLSCEYDPQPPFDSGSVLRASPELRRRVDELNAAKQR